MSWRSADGLTIVHGNVRAARGQWATGGGAYRLYVPDPYVALVASSAGLTDLGALVEAAHRAQPPLETLESQLRLAHPTMAWVGSPAITATADRPEDGPPAQP